ncbi:sortase [Patescibacteria group bacterium]
MKSGKKEKSKSPSNKNLTKALIIGGISFLMISLFIFTLIFFPVVKEEIRYRTVINMTSGEVQGPQEIVPVDTDFGIVIPKIGANAKVVENVDPHNSREYQVKLTEGIAHAKGSPLPGEFGNTFLFAHSSDNFYNANRYNAVFYLLNKMEKSDKFFLIKDNVRYEYEVEEKSIVEAEQVEYMDSDLKTQKATLMTCWPPGTTIKRLVVVGNLVKEVSL